MSNLENYFINLFPSKHIGDDGAIIEKNLVVVQDGFFENVHFRRDWLSLDEVAYKAVAVNISDIYSMNGVPKYGLITIAIPKEFSKQELQLLYQGFSRASKNFQFEIIGGDTISNSKLDISITIIGKVRGKPILRSGAERGDLVAYTGTLGNSKRDLEKLLSGRKITKNSIFRKPKLNRDFIFKVAPYISSGLDISDGLFSELSHIAKSSKVGFHLWKPIPKQIGCSGEEYQFLFTFPKRNRRRIESIGKSLNTKVTIFGEVTNRKKYINPCKPHHF